MNYYDKREIRSADERAKDISLELPKQIERAKTTGLGALLRDVDPGEIDSLEALAALPVLRKSKLGALQAENPPLGGLIATSISNLDHVFQSPGPIYEPGRVARDWWRVGRFLHACGIGKDDLVQNCFSYHMTPAGSIFENGARAVGATVFPAGVGNTELQAVAAANLGVTAYAGTPDYLKAILESADEAGLDLSRIKKAAVGAGALFPSVRAYYAERGIHCLQCYATADLGNISYETVADEGLVIDEGVFVEIVTPGTGNPVPEGEIGEVLVTTLNEDYPLIRFATGDLSAMLPGMSSCGRTNMRMVGWKGRADQTTKIKGMFVHPEQVAQIVEKHGEVKKARVVVTRSNEADVFTVKLETEVGEVERYKSTVQEILKLRGRVEICAPGTLPNDGKVIDDQRSYD